MPRKGPKARAAKQREQKKIELNELMNENVQIRANTNIDIRTRTVIAGNLHQGNRIFEYPGVQCTFLSLYALVYMFEKPPHLWNGNDIDSCVIIGNDKFIKHCFERGMDPQMLLAKELPSRLSVDNNIYTCLQSENEVKVGTLGISSTSDEVIITSLDNAFEQTFHRFQSCLFLCGGITIALAKHESTFYIFDSHSRDRDGFVHPIGNAVLVTCKNICQAKQFVCELFTHSLRLSASEQFEVVPVSISKENETVPSVLNDLTQDTNQDSECGSCKVIQTGKPSITPDTTNQELTDDPIHKYETETTNKSTETMNAYFADQYERDKAHKQRKRHIEAELFDSTSKRRKYMQSYMQKARRCDAYKSAENYRNKQRMFKICSTPEGREKNRKQVLKTRSSCEGKAKHRESAAIQMKKIRSTPEGQMKNRLIAAKGMKRIRSTSEGQSVNRESAAIKMKKMRNTPEEKNRNKEIAKAGMNKLLSTKKGKEKHNKLSAKTMKFLRKRKNYAVREYEQAKKRRIGESFSDAVGKFEKAISCSCSYVCSCCHQLWFKQSIKPVSALYKSDSLDTNLLKQSLTGYLSVDDIEWICNTCIGNIKSGKVPKLSVMNGMGFPNKPPELNLSNLEERLISLRIPFMQIRALNSGGQFSLKGSVVNVPANIEPTIRALPRARNDYETIPVKPKRMKEFKHAVETENIKPAAVMTALRSLMDSSEMYKEANLSIDEHWNTPNSDEETPTTGVYDEKRDDSDSFSENENGDNIPIMTLLDKQTVDRNEVLSLAPGEGQRPISVFKDPNSEYLAFPTIFCGQKRMDNSDRKTPVYYSDICKWELRSVDRRVALNVPNIFYKMKKLQTEQVCSKAHLAIRRCKTKGKQFTAGNILKDNMGESLVRLDEGYRIFRTIRNSPQYWQNQKKEVFAMIRQLGIPTLFMSFSANDLNWADLIVTLGKIVDNQDYSEDLKNNTLSWQTRSRLVQSDPVTCVRHFDNRVNQFIQTILKNKHSPLGFLSDFFYRVEFQQRGSPHIHMLAWIKDAPKYGEANEADVVKYIDSIISCSADVPQDQKQFVDLQRHKHSRSCRKGGKAECRFGIPFPPMRETLILQPYTADDKPEFEKYYSIVQNYLRNLKQDISFDEFLSEQYMKAVQTSIKTEKIFFLKRTPIENRINPYIKDMLDVWRANHDIQFVLDAYACAMYIVSYVNKSSKGMSSLMTEACKEARNGNKTLKESVRHIGNKFLNAVEVSAQEAAYLVLQLNMSLKSRSCEFLPTSPRNERTFLLKSQKELEDLPDESTDIEADNVIKRYARRPDSLENYCLADFVAKVVSVSTIATDDCKQNNKPSDETEQNNFSNASDDLNTEAVRYSVVNGNSKIVLRVHPKIIRYVKYDEKIDPENYFREQLMLFYPWRHEQNDLLNSHESYESSFKDARNVIELNKRQYDGNNELLDNVEKATDTLEQDNFDTLFPNMEINEAHDDAQEPNQSNKYAFYSPETYEQSYHDLGADLGIATHIASDPIEIIQNILPEKKYLELLSKLNSKQRQIVTHIINSLTFEPKKQLCLFITGGAGVGKSLVIRTLYQTLHRLLCSDYGRNPEDTRILLCAYTGLAAYNIQGSTLHSAFSIEPNKKLTYKQLSDDKRNTLQAKYRDLTVLVVDEVSMVGNEMLNFLYLRLQEIKGNKEHFGGVHIILVGDLFQLRPVGDGWIFSNTSFDYTALATNLWKTHFKMFELTEIMRQKDDVLFAEMLNRIREGNHTKDDLAALEARRVKLNEQKYQMIKNELHLFPCNAAVDAHNVNMFEASNEEKTEIECYDTVLGDDSNDVKQKILIQVKGRKVNDTGNLNEKLCVAVGLQYDTTHNVSVLDGLCNGTPCILRKIHYMEDHKSVPSCLWVEFPDEAIGRNTRKEYSHYFKKYPTVSRKWTPIWCIRRTFMFRRKAIVRQQFPLQASSAKTIHKAQGQTKESIVVEMSNGSRSHQHYVAYSRVTKLQGLHLNGLTGKIRVDESVIKEMERLRKDECLGLSYKPVSSYENAFIVSSQNVQSLRLHQPQLQNDETFTSADVICLSETRLSHGDLNQDYALKGFLPILRNDQQSNVLRPPHGLAMFVKSCHCIPYVDMFSTNKFECITVEVVDKHTHITYTIVHLYKAPSCGLEEFKAFVHNLKFRATDKLVIIGDFNFDVSRNQNKEFILFMESFFPKSRMLGTSFTTRGNSILDLCFTNCEQATATILPCMWSYHHTLVASFS